MQDFETLGAFYLGRPYDLATRTAAPAPLMYDARDLLTHAVCIGMTGSGKTGLCVGLIEEALIDGVPAIIIDPKGDLANLALTFPTLSAEAFAPWVNAEDAQRAGLDVATYAGKEADTWRAGLASWGQSPERIARLRQASEVTIYTPGSSAGVPVSIFKSFAAPPPAIRDDRELLRERLATTVSSLLGLAGLTADAPQSREHILLSTLLDAGWRDGRDVDLVSLIQQIQAPPMSRVGALDLEAFYPARERFALAMALNTLLAAPGFDQWMTGEALDIAAMLRTRDGRPRAAVFSIAHLNDAERMFFVSLLLSEVLGWVRTQSGTTSLRALLYMDEVVGYLPPVANPPSKAPLLLLLKQARAFGMGVVLATQNPVDLDYKALSNTGTWFIGRLQTERDKARVLEGLEGAGAGAAGFDRQAMSQVLAGLGSRIFLMHNVHEDAPVTFETRWTLSYLRGPLTRMQIRQLTPAPLVDQADQAGKPATRTHGAQATAALTTPPVLPPGVTALFVPRRGDAAGATLDYQPAVYAAGTVRITDSNTALDHTTPVQVIVPLHDAPVPLALAEAEAVDLTPGDLEAEPRGAASYAPLPAAAVTPRNQDAWRKVLVTWLYDTHSLALWQHAGSGLRSKPDEQEGAFRTRVAEHLREQRDSAVDALRKKYAAKISVQQERLRRAEQQVGKQQQDVTQSATSATMTVVTGVFGALFGRKAFSAANAGRLGTAARGAGRVVKERQDVTRAQETLAAEQQKLADLQAAIEADVSAAAAAADGDRAAVTPLLLRPKKTGITVSVVSLVWNPRDRSAG
ncbi:MAG: ATP-binding protein [Luteitalea sp.]